MTAALPRQIVPALAMLFALVAWTAVVLVGADAAGMLRAEIAPPVVTMPTDDPCSLRAPLATATESRCTFDLRRKGAAPLVVDLEQTWEANVLIQRLSVRGTAAHPLYALATRSAGPRPARLHRLFAVPAGDEQDHLTYVMGLCGGVTCGQSEVWVIDPVAGGVAPLAKLSVERSPVVDLRPDGTLEIVESADRLGVGTLVITTLRWDDRRYRTESVTRQRRGPR